MRPGADLTRTLHNLVDHIARPIHASGTLTDAVPTTCVTCQSLREQGVVYPCPFSLIVAQTGVRQLTSDFGEHETLGVGFSCFRAKGLAQKIRVYNRFSFLERYFVGLCEIVTMLLFPRLHE